MLGEARRRLIPPARIFRSRIRAPRHEYRHTIVAEVRDVNVPVRAHGDAHLTSNGEQRRGTKRNDNQRQAPIPGRRSRDLEKISSSRV